MDYNDKNQNEQLEFFEKQHELNIDKESTEIRKNKKGSFRRGFFSGIFGGIISAVIVVLLLSNNLTPTNVEEVNNKHSIADDAKDVPAISDVVASDSIHPESIDEISKAVVGIINLRQQNIWSPSEEAGAGSGIIYKKENGKAYIITNNHVVKGAEEVRVQFKNEERVKAKILGMDELTDLAVLEIDGSKVENVAKLGSSDKLHIGETVLAIGNPLGMDLSGTVTKGIISGLNRSIQVATSGGNQPDWIAEVIQTDAAINPGNSGGALVNTKGEVIGINSMKIATQAVEGIGFAIPIDSALPIIEQLETDGEIVRPFIGITTANMTQVPPQYRDRVILPEGVESGMVIANVEVGSPADDAGLQQFDIITKIDEQEIKSILDLRKYMYSKTKVGDKVNVELYRDGKKKNVELTLSAREK